MRAAAVGLALMLLCPGALEAGGPLIVSGNGTPYVWDLPVRYRVDRGGLGSMTNAEGVAFVDGAFAEWSAVPTTSVAFLNAGLLAADVNTVTEFNAHDGCTAGDSAIIFDVDGSLFTALGFSSGVIGFAGPTCVTTSAPFRIIKGMAALNGKWQDGSAANGELTASEFFGTFVHEFGHFLNLDHSQVNGHYFLGDTNDPGFVTFGAPGIGDVEIMFPFALDGMDSAPKRDDAAALSALYPSASFGATTGAIAGRVLLGDGTTPFQGANVVARNPADPFADAVSNVSGARYVSGASQTLKGLYELPALSPGADYAVEVTRVNSQFVGGSGVGPLSPPATLPGPEEFYSGAAESNSDTAGFTPVPSVAGVPTTGIDVVLNTTSGPGPGHQTTHDLAVVAITAPTAVPVNPTYKRRVTVKIQNRSDHSETIPSMAALANLVSLQVLPLGAPCSPAPAVSLRPRTMPVTIAPKNTLLVYFRVVFACAIDPLRGAGHEDYRYVATVNHAALTGAVADGHTADDVCPRGPLATPGNLDPNPDGTIVDKGCGGKFPNGTLGADVKTDVYVP